MNGTVADAEAFEATVDEYGYERIMQRCDASSLADVLTRGVVNPAAIVTARYTIEGVNEALRDLENGTVVGAAVLVMEPLT